MAVVNLTKSNFTEIVKQPGTVLVDFWASWCGPCRMFAPVFEQAALQHGDITFGKVNTESEVELARTFGISSIPTLMVVRDGVVVYAQPGALPAVALEELITWACELDMDQVRADARPHR
ncbi:thioredoxin [Lentzea sp. NEAU-D7]|uniref:thioredoxin n=1 Tax=Lentzea sp. NEAU-D7 TaxID=2994667 RepID=UPI00224AD605|nr:thioredoxin [Lentzea sp. NEAU-D7]MCX2951481.1 thioredoxin [Lentzea sp. NEAU-D7]